jgi:DNA-binding transcriptional ArsR family regulator
VETREAILRHIKKKGRITTSELGARLGISRQALHLHLKALIGEGLVEKTGSTRNAAYVLSGAESDALSFTKRYSLKGLEEDKVYDEIAFRLRLHRALSQRARTIVYYAFTEMLNNAIDHSKSEACDVRFTLEAYDVVFSVRDFGIGVFHSIADRFGLPDQEAAIGELVKGKTTTMKEKHTGEGIFFTSKVADRLRFRSHRLELEFHAAEDDVFVRDRRNLKGTEVQFTLSRRSRRKLEDVFQQYSPREFDYRFERTRVQVKLFNREYVSRSEARRLLHGLEQFSVATLDFKNVRSMGQAFADEIFRVFQQRHPTVRLEPTNMGSAVRSVVRHVLDK